MTEPGPLLNYSTPRAFFDRGYSHRSSNQVVGAIAVLVMGGLALFMASRAAQAPGLPFRAAVVALLMLATACAAGFVWMAVKWAKNAIDPVRITDEGIEHGGRVYRWDGISSVYGTTVAGGIMIQFDERGDPGQSLKWMLSRHLMTTPFLSPAEFETLLDDLAAHVIPHHPHVKLDRTPRRSSD